MRFLSQSIDGLALIKPDVFEDVRGSFRRNFCAKEFEKHGIEISVFQGNVSENRHAFTLRGFHYQKKPSRESKVLTPMTGSIFNVVIDLRPNSLTYLQSVSLELSSSRKESLHVPAGCANAFLTLEPNTIVQYYMGDYFKPESYSGFRYDDPYFAIKWPYAPIVISERDMAFPNFSLADL